MSALLLLRSPIGPVWACCQENSEPKDNAKGAAPWVGPGHPAPVTKFWCFPPQVYHAGLWQHVQLLHCSFHTWPGEESACCLHSRGSEEAFWAGEKFSSPSYCERVCGRMRTTFLVLQPVLSLSCTSLEPYLARKKYLGVHLGFAAQEL